MAVVVSWFYGPTALHALESSIGTSTAVDSERSGQTVHLGRVGFRSAPDWATPEILPAILADLEPRLQAPDGSRRVALLDHQGVDGVLETLRASPWVVDVSMTREFPDRLGVRFQLRRPVLEVRSADGQPVFCVDRRGVCLPAVSAGLPFTAPRGAWVEAPRIPELGRVHPDPRVLAALDVALTWRDVVAPELGGKAPTLLEVDAFNLDGLQLFGARDPEIRVFVARADGAAVSLAWGRPSTTHRSTVPTATKIEILRQILDRHPGLGELTGGDLRFANLWETWLLPRTGPDPVPEGF